MKIPEWIQQFVFDSKFRHALFLRKEARVLLEYIRNNHTVPGAAATATATIITDEQYQTLVTAAARDPKEPYEVDEETKLLQTMDALSNALKPKTLESILASQSWRAKWRTLGYGISCAAYFVFFFVGQAYYVVGTNIMRDSGKAEEKLRTEIEAFYKFENEQIGVPNVANPPTQLTKIDLKRNDMQMHINEVDDEVRLYAGSLTCWNSVWRFSYKTFRSCVYWAVQFLPSYPEGPKTVSLLPQSPSLASFLDLSPVPSSGPSSAWTWLAGTPISSVWTGETPTIWTWITGTPKAEDLKKGRSNQLLFDLEGERVSASIVLDLLGIFLLPLFTGFLGASLFVLRKVVADRENQTFRLTESYWPRIVVGGLAGVLLVLMFKSSVDGSLATLPLMALSFLGGYSVDAVFSICDRLANIIPGAPKPNGG